MSIPESTVTQQVIDNPDRSRFELVEGDDVIAFADYRLLGQDGSTVALPHTVVTHARRGHGLGEILVRGALDQLRDQGRTIVPQCWFVAEFVETHPEYQDLVAH